MWYLIMTGCAASLSRSSGVLNIDKIKINQKKKQK